MENLKKSLMENFIFCAVFEHNKSQKKDIIGLFIKK